MCLSAGNRKNQVEIKSWLCSAKVCSVWVHRTVSGAPDSGKLAALGKGLTAYNYNSPDCPVCTGLSGEPTVGRANGRPRDLRETRGRANGRKGAPDCLVCTGQCPVRQRLQSANGRLRQIRKEIRTGLSGAPGDRRQELPSWNALNGS